LAIKAYFDGSGKYDDPASTHITLAGWYGTEDQWSSFDALWDQLKSYHQVPYIHMVDIVGGQPPYGRRFVDDEIGLKKLLLACVKVIKDCKLVPMSYSVRLLQKRSARNYEATRQLLDTEMLCIDGCLMRFILTHPISDAPLILYFDQGEAFASRLNKIGRDRKRWTKFSGGWIDPPIYADMRKIDRIQAADILAWTINRRLNNKGFKWLASSLGQESPQAFDSIDLLVCRIEQLKNSPEFQNALQEMRKRETL